MRLLGQVASIILALIAIPLFTAAACNIAVQISLLSPDTYRDALADETIFEDLLPVTLPALIQIVSETDPEFAESFPINSAAVNQNLSREERREIAELLIPGGWLQVRFNQLVDALLRIAAGDFDVINEPVNLGEVRQRLSGEEAEQAAAIIINAAPACTQAQINQIAQVRRSGEGQIPICMSSAAEVQAFIQAQITGLFSELAGALGDDMLTVEEFYRINRNRARMINLFIELDRQALTLLYLCPMALLSLIVIFAVRSAKSFGRWLGTVNVISGIVILLMIFFMQVTVIGSFANLLDAQNEFEQFMARLLAGLLRSLFSQSSATMLIQAGTFIAIGFVLLAMSFMIRHDPQEGNLVLITEDGEIISTASLNRQDDSE